MQVNRGTIQAFGGSWLSGLGYLLIDDVEQGPVSVPCENAPTVRALEACFGDVIGEGHTVDHEGGHVGKEVFYSMDEMGLVLAAFTPVEDASPELVEAYEKERASELV